MSAVGSSKVIGDAAKRALLFKKTKQLLSALLNLRLLLYTARSI